MAAGDGVCDRFGTGVGRYAEDVQNEEPALACDFAHLSRCSHGL